MLSLLVPWPWRSSNFASVSHVGNQDEMSRSRSLPSVSPDSGPQVYSASPFCVPHSSPSPPLIARMSLCPGAPEGRGSVRWEALELPSPAQSDAKTCGLALPKPGTPLPGFESSAGSARPLLKKGGRRNPREGLSPRCRLPWQPVPSPAVTLR